MSTISGWAAWKDGSPHHPSLERTKRSLLIGYDMMPLRGLRQTEKVLASKGIVIARTVATLCVPEDRDCYCLSVRGRLDAGSLSWPISHRGGGVWKVHDPRSHELLTLKSACGYVSCQAEAGVSVFCDASAGEIKNLRQLWWGWPEVDYADPSQPRDKRRRATLARMWAEARATFGRLGIALAPVALRRVEAAR